MASKLPIPGLSMSATTAFDMHGDGLKDLLITGQNHFMQLTTSVYINKGCFAPCENETEITVKNCGPYKSPSGNYEWTESGTYTDVLKNKAGCDSIITIHLQTSSTGSMTAVACDSFVAPSGKVYNTSGEYEDIIKGGNQFGCDSVIHLSLAISGPQKMATKLTFSILETNGLDYGSSIATADFDGDNFEDIVIYNRKGTKVYKNNAGGNFSEMADLGQLKGTYIITADLNGDSKPDILSGKAEIFSLNPLRIFINNGGNFTELTGTPFQGDTCLSFAVEDLDQDNKPDILFGAYSWDGKVGKKSVKIYKNDGAGNFLEISTNLPACFFYHQIFSTGDIDGDGKADVVYSGNVQDLDNILPAKVFKNNGGGSFSEMAITNIKGLANGSVILTDFDADSKPDLLITGSPDLYHRLIPTTILYKNNGGGSFSEVTGTQFPQLYKASLSVADVDGDTRPDVLMSGIYGFTYDENLFTTQLFKNTGGMTFSEINIDDFDRFDGGSMIKLTDMDGDQKPDILFESILYINQMKVFNGGCIAPTGCNSYTSPSGKYTWTKSGVYIDTLHLSDYDSIITINLLIDSIQAKYTTKKDPDGKYDLLVVNKSKGKGMSFTWDFGDGKSGTGVAPNHTYDAAGTYNLCLILKTAAGCTDTFCQEITFTGKKAPFTIQVIDSVDGTIAVGMEESPLAGDNSLSFSIYPNPANHTLNVVNHDFHDYDLILRDMSGRQLMYLQDQQGKSQIDLSEIKPALYIIEIRSDNRQGFYKVFTN